MKFALNEVLNHMAAAVGCSRTQVLDMAQFTLLGQVEVFSSNIDWNKKIVPVIPNFYGSIHFKGWVNENMSYDMGYMTEANVIVNSAGTDGKELTNALGEGMAATLIRYASLNMICLFNINDLRISNKSVKEETERWATEGRLRSAAECWDAADDEMLLKIFAYSEAFSLVDKEMFCLWCANAPCYKDLAREQFSSYEKNPSTIDDLNKFVFYFGNGSHKLESETSKWLRKVMEPNWAK